MIRFLTDENFNNEIVRGVLRRIPDVEFVRVQDTELFGKPDPLLLNWAVEYSYFLLSHDVNTMRGYFYDRVETGLPVPGLFLIPRLKPIGEVIESLEILILASEAVEWESKITYLPF